ncbi:MAG: ABC transporter ATP-binding protein/permease [Bdellovibrionales bacterium]|nr:ABC transporter ATP-binding protein/permease [Bdellovibrionales bacterium]
MQGETPRSPLKGLRKRWHESALLRQLMWEYRRPIAIGLLTLVIVDILEVIPPILLKHAVDVVVERKPLEEIWWMAAAYFFITLIQGFCRYGWRRYLLRSSFFAGQDLRNRFSKHLFSLSPSFFDRKRLGDLMSLSSNDVEAVRAALGSGLLVAADALFYFVSVPVAMLILSPQLTLLAFLPLPLIPWLVARNERLIHQRFEKVQQSFGKLSALAQETLTGVRVIKAFAAEPGQLERFRKAGQEYMDLNMSFARVQSSFGPLLDFTMSLGLVALLWVGGHHALGGTETLGTFVAFQRYIQKMVWPMAAVGMAVSFYQRGVASSRRLQDVFDEKSEILEAPDFSQSELNHAPGPRAIQGEIEFRNLSFRYSGSEENALDRVSLVIPAKARVAFVGAVGSGKSTLLSLIPRLYPAFDGSIFLDGRDLNQYRLSELRKNIGFVGQDLFLFSETVDQNLGWGLDEVPARSALLKLSERVALDGEIERLPQGFATLLGERGVNLSGGQRQRLTIARAIARSPAILILDDALSAVDTRTESRLLGELRSREHRCTELIAAHRISSIQEADWIVVLDRGRLIQQGTHQQLISEAGGLYRDFYDQQKLEEELAHYGERADQAPIAPGV